MLLLSTESNLGIFLCDRAIWCLGYRPGVIGVEGASVPLSECPHMLATHKNHNINVSNLRREHMFYEWTGIISDPEMIPL